MADIFVSYSRQDKAQVAPLVASLEAEGWSIWWDPEITPGEEFDALISRELEGARSLVVVWSPNSVDSRWVRGEDRKGTAFRSLCKALEAMLGAPKKPAPNPAVSDSQPEVSICVLPFANMSGDPEQEYFSDGITEDIITDLGKVSALSIVSRNLAFSFKGAKGGVGDIGRQTKSSHVLVGSVRKAGDRVRITAQLVNASNEAQVWGERYDRDLKDIFALQDEISKAIVAALKLTLLPEEKRALEQRATTNVKAYKFYLMARQFSVMGNERHQEIIVRLCKRAVELDPSYAAPWATMAIAQWDMHRRSACDEDGQEAANQAIRLDPQLADAHAALGAAHQGQGRYETGLKACESALQLEPNSYEGNRVAGMCSMRAAARRALTRIEKVIAVEPDHGRALGYGAGLLASLGEGERAKEWIERGTLLDPDNTILHFNFVCALTRLKALEAAIDLLSSVIDKASQGWLVWLDNDTDLDPLRSSPRFVEIVQKAKARFAIESAAASSGT